MANWQTYASVSHGSMSSSPALRHDECLYAFTSYTHDQLMLRCLTSGTSSFFAVVLYNELFWSYQTLENPALFNLCAAIEMEKS